MPQSLPNKLLNAEQPQKNSLRLLGGLALVACLVIRSSQQQLSCDTSRTVVAAPPPPPPPTSHWDTSVSQEKKGDPLARYGAPEQERTESSTAAAWKSDRLCRSNPYIASLNRSLADVQTATDRWLADMDAHLIKAALPEQNKHNHERFAAAFPVVTDCAKSCVGGKCNQDVSKVVCGLDELQKMVSGGAHGGDDDGGGGDVTRTNTSGKNDHGSPPPCVVYSVGGNNQWEFERDILAKTPCHVHTMDCTGPASRFQKPISDRLSFHHVCLGDQHVPYNQDTNCTDATTICGPILTLRQIQVMLGHIRIDLFKMDIEGYEWPLFESWPTLTGSSTTDCAAEQTILPMQILVEIHSRTHMAGLWPAGKKGKVWREDWKSAVHHIRLQEHLLKAGYTVANRDDNVRCKHCTELTLVRTQC
jgi:hypothetical protein